MMKAERRRVRVRRQSDATPQTADLLVLRVLEGGGN